MKREKYNLYHDSSSSKMKFQEPNLWILNIYELQMEPKQIQTNLHIVKPDISCICTCITEQESYKHHDHCIQ